MCIVAMAFLASVSARGANVALAADATDVGVVVDYSPPGAALYLERGGARQPVRIAAVVQAGDKIELPANSSVTVELTGNRRMSSSGPGTWQVPDAPSLGSIAGYFHRLALIMDPDYRQSASAITRGVAFCKGESIRVPELPEGARVKAGRRGVSLAWTGGCPPYQLELKSAHGTLAESRVAVREFRFEGLSLEPGLYSVSITDKAGTTVKLPFTASLDAPAWPDTLAGSSSHLGTVARALWLAEVDHGAWRLDSVELLLPLRREHDSLAEAVSRRLLSEESVGGLGGE
jgi:hypothetical protein